MPSAPQKDALIYSGQIVLRQRSKWAVLCSGTFDAQSTAGFDGDLKAEYNKADGGVQNGARQAAGTAAGSSDVGGRDPVLAGRPGVQESNRNVAGGGEYPATDRVLPQVSGLTPEVGCAARPGLTAS